MKKVTRTIVTTVVRYKEASGKQQVKYFTFLEPYLVSELVSQGAQELEIGYAPLLFSLDEDEYIKAAECLTDVSNVQLYKEKKDCPLNSRASENSKQ